MDSRNSVFDDPGQRTAALARLGRVLGSLANGATWTDHGAGLTASEHDRALAVLGEASARNPWFTLDNVRHALQQWATMLAPAPLQEFMDAHGAREQGRAPLRIGVIMAGNIPLVGLHDLVCVLLSGHTARVRNSSDDAGLTPLVVDLLGLLAPELAQRVVITDGKLGEVDALIATGSNNTARYFEHYFGHLPRIIRKSRTSVAVLDGSETPAELEALGEDIFRYFGLGCRNVGKVFMPQDMDTDRIFQAIFHWKDVVLHGKYASNYDYHKAIWLLDQVPIIENGFLLLKEDQALHSPVGSLFVERYAHITEVQERLRTDADKLQCVVGHGYLPFGSAQTPALDAFADDVDTMAFLAGL